jgi:hypothetical protein
MIQTSPTLLDGLLTRLATTPADAKQRLAATLRSRLGAPAWIPNIGPQSAAYDSAADELFYSGAAGSGKTDLGVGLALTAHRRALMPAAHPGG